MPPEKESKRAENTKKMQSILNSPDGEFMLKMIDDMTDYSRDVFMADPYIHAAKAGARSVSVNLHNLLDLKGSENEKTV